MPYLAPLSWYLGEECTGDVSPCRAVLPGDVRLTIPLAGGRKALRAYMQGGDAELSEHGNWRHTHIGAIRSVFGRYPYFSHYFPEIERLIADASCRSLRKLNMAVHSALCRDIFVSGAAESLSLAAGRDPEFVGNLCAERMRGLDPHVSMLAALFSLGPDTIFLFFRSLIS